MDTKFMPVRGPEDKILGRSLQNGYIYFTTDTGKVYLDTATERISIGGSGITILYGNFEKIEPNDEAQYEILVSQLEEGSGKPHVNDLILNQDGTFYRISRIIGDLMLCQLISISGGGGGTGPAGGYRTKLKLHYPPTTSLIDGQEFIIQFEASAEKDANSEYISDRVTISWSLEELIGLNTYNEYKAGQIDNVLNDTLTSLDLTKFIKPSAKSRLVITASTLGGEISGGNSVTQNLKFISSQLISELGSTFSNTTIYTTDNVAIPLNVRGDMEKRVKVYVGYEKETPRLVNTYDYGPEDISENIYLNKLTSLKHGAQTVLIRTFQIVDGKENTEIEKINFEIAVKDISSKLPIIWLGGYQEKYFSYDDIRIPFLVYDPENTNTTEVRLYHNGIEMSGSPRTESGSGASRFSIFEIIDAEIGVRNYYSISCGENERRVERQIEFLVEEDTSRDMTVEKHNLKLLFDAKGRSNNESLSNRSNWSYNGITATFENFNWYNNGWVEDESGNTCLRISNGAKVTFPVGQLTLASGDADDQSSTIEMQFKVKNIQDYTPLIHNVTRYQGDSSYYSAFKNQTEYTNYDSFLAYWLPLQNLADDKGEPITYDSLKFDYVQKDINLTKAAVSYVKEGSTAGFCVGSQDSFFSNGTNTVNVSFVEDEMIYLTAVYTHDNKLKSNKLLTIYINGVLTGAIESSLDAPHTIGNKNFVFNSEFCDIDLYKMRVYNTSLSLNQVIKNYAVDKKDVVIFDQNDIHKGFVIDDTNIKELRLSFSGIEKYNQDNPGKYTMPYIVFDTSKLESDKAKKLPWSKDVKFKGVGVTFINAPLDAAYYNGELEDLAIEEGLCQATDSPEDRMAAVEYYYAHHCPSWTGHDIEMSVQGTSSQFYPRRNYKLKCKPDEEVNIFLNRGPFTQKYLENGNKYENNPCHMDFFYMNNYEVGTTKFTMKIDYMESSGSYNTGFANLVANAYSKHPMQDYVEAKRFKQKDGSLYEISEDYLKSVRTSVQGYPVLAFHKRGPDDYVYIGRYNMNLDKGSDEAFGFKPDKNMYITDMNGKLTKVRDLAECWEMQNNSRGFCSFRDPWNRRELSFDGTGEKNPYTSFGSPIIADNIEYRYSAYDDALDMLWELSENTDLQKRMDIFENLGWVELVDSIDGIPVDEYTQVGGKIYQHTEPDLVKEYNFSQDNLEPGRKLFLRLLSNWERATKWVWSTNPENVIRGGEYTKITLGKQLYKPDTFFILQESEDGESFQYIKDPNNTFNPDITYYQETDTIDEEGNTVTTYINAWVVGDSAHLYVKDKFFVKLNDGTYVLSVADTFNPSEVYFTFKFKSSAEMDRIIAAGEALHTVKLEPGVTYDGVLYNYDTQEYRLAKFRNEIRDHFDPEYLATYFIMTEVFECYDSRGKNAMWASWGPLRDGGDYVWYPIFYDIDTQLGINNTGIPSFEYNVDATEAGNFSTSDSVLWNNFYKCFKETFIIDKYKQLKGQDSNYFGIIKNPILSDVNKIEKWYKCDPVECNSIAMRGIRPLIAINLDEQFKYLTIYNKLGTPENPDITPDSPLYGLTGRISDNGEYVTESTSYHYALQGDRSLSRRQFLTNRIEYIDSWLNVGNYARGGYNRVWGRISARRPINEETGQFLNSDRWYEDTQNPNTSYYLEDGSKRYDFDSEYWATLTPIRNSYVTIQDDSAVYPSKKFSGVPVKIDFKALESGIRTAKDYNEQLCYIYGINQMKNLGDLYRMYWQEFKIEGSAKKLTKLLLGCDGLMTKKEPDGSYSLVLDENGDTVVNDPELNPDKLKAYRWFNAKMNDPSMPSGADQTGMPLLKEANFSNITINNDSPVLDLTSCEKLEDFRATGSNFTQVKFAPGVALNTLYLPHSITNLELSEARMLTNLVTEYKYPIRLNNGDYKMEQKGLYIEGLTDDTLTKTNINTISLLGDNLGYNSYILLSKYWNLIKSVGEKNITMTGVNWCPYYQLVEGDAYNPDEGNLYFKDNGHYGLSKYNYTNEKLFKADLLNGELYKLNISLDGPSHLIDSDTMFREIKEDNEVRIEGTMLIHNTEPIDELTVNELNAKNNYPKLKLFYTGEINKAYSAKFVLPVELIDPATNTWSYKYVPVKNSSELSIQKVSPDNYVSTKNIFASPFERYLPEKLHHIFIGWSTDPTGKTNILKTETDWNNFIIAEGSYDTTFYAIFEIKKYRITFSLGSEGKTWYKDMPYGGPIELPPDQPWADDSDLPLTETYSFRGYSSFEPENGKYHEAMNDDMVDDLSNAKVSAPRTYYPVFTPMSVYNNIHTEYFNFNNGIISWNNKYTLKGKLTIPYSINGIPVRGISQEGFSPYGSAKGVANVTHIFWSDVYGPQSPSFTELSVKAFAGLSKLKYFEMPSLITNLKLGCFNSDTQLFVGSYSDSDSTDYYLVDFLKNIVSIGDTCFNFVPFKDIVISDKTISIQSGAFKSLPKNISGATITLGNNLDFDSCGSEIFKASANRTVFMPAKYDTTAWREKFDFDSTVTINII